MMPPSTVEELASPVVPFLALCCMVVLFLLATWRGGRHG